MYMGQGETPLKMQDFKHTCIEYAGIHRYTSPTELLGLGLGLDLGLEL